MHFDFNNPTHILFGSGALNDLSSQTMPGKKAMLLMSCGKSAKVSGAYDRTLEQLAKAGVEVAEFAKVMENPLKNMIMDGAAFARENGCDFIVALGGGEPDPLPFQQSGCVQFLQSAFDGSDTIVPRFRNLRNGIHNECFTRVVLPAVLLRQGSTI